MRWFKSRVVCFWPISSPAILFCRPMARPEALVTANKEVPSVRAAARMMFLNCILFEIMTVEGGL